MPPSSPYSGVSASRLRAQSKAPRLAPSQTSEFPVYSYFSSFSSFIISLFSPCSHLSCQSNSFPFIVLCPLGSLICPSLFVGCPFFHPGVLFSYLTLFFYPSAHLKRYSFQFSVFQSRLFTSSSSSVFSFILLSQLYFLPPILSVFLSLSCSVFNFFSSFLSSF